MADLLDVFADCVEGIDYLTSHGEELVEGFGTIQQHIGNFQDRAGLEPAELMKAAAAHGNIAVPSCLLAATGADGSTGFVGIRVMPQEPMPDGEFWGALEVLHSHFEEQLAKTEVLFSAVQLLIRVLVRVAIKSMWPSY